MKTKLTFKLLALCLLSAVLCLRAVAQPTMVSYQGQLYDGGNLANGSYDMTFTFYIGATGGTPLAPPVTVNPVSVNNGLFTVDLMVSSGIFSFGTIGAHFVEIAARPSGSPNPYTVLTPRQLLTQTPYAIAAQSAAVADTVLTNSVTAAGIAAGQVVKSLNGLEDVVTLAAGANITLTPNGQTITIASTGGGGGNDWLLTGNAGTTAGLNYLGTSDSQPLEMHVNNQRALRLEPDASTHGSPNVIGGSPNNVVSGAIGATIAGGGSSSAINSVMQAYGTVGGGSGNTASGGNATVSGGLGNTASGGLATVTGGSGNTASAYWTMVGGGAGNTASTAYATVGGGLVNNATNSYATIAGGQYNAAGGIGAFIGGGGVDGNNTAGNVASGSASVVAGGIANTASGYHAAVVGGTNNTANNAATTVAGGRNNLASGIGAFVGGGGDDGITSPSGNVASGSASVVCGGVNNQASAVWSTIGGGFDNAANSSRATVAGGQHNTAGALGATVSGGVLNTASGGNSTVGGGDGNIAGNVGAVVSGGFDNMASGNSAFVGGGLGNTATNTWATISGGTSNSVGNVADAILGGSTNTIFFATLLGGNNVIAGGTGNEIIASEYGTIGGGISNLVWNGTSSFTGTGSTVPGGAFNAAGGNYSFAAGFHAQANDNNSFVWSDGSQPLGFASTGPGTFNVLASGGTYISHNCSVCTLTIRGGCDLAEPFQFSAQEPEEIPQGSVVVIDERNPGHLKLSDEPYDTRVAGVVSGANGVNPGIQMHQQGMLEGGRNVALTGRVYVRADASTGTIYPGDLLTTSSIPGYAMLASDHAKAQGAVLGKAMTGLSEGQGMVLVLVTLQ